MQKRIFPKDKVVCMPQNTDDIVMENITKKKKLVVDDKYKYKKNWLVRTWQFFLYYCIAKPVFFLYDKIFLGVKVYGRKNIKGIKSAITVSNHVHYLDFSFATNFICRMHRTHVVSNTDNFDIPVAGRLISAYGVMPLPQTPKASINFYKQITEYLKKGRYIHIYPEASNWFYYNKLRPHKSGAYHFASKNNVPVIPYVIVFRPSKGLHRLIRKRPLVSLYICKPIYPDTSLDIRDCNEDLMQKTLAEMQEVLDSHPSFEYWRYIPENQFDYSKYDKKEK